MWDFRARLGLTIDRQEVEDLLTRTAKFLNTHENTVCRGNVIEICDLAADFGCRFDYKEEVINNNALVDLRNKMAEILAGADE